VNDTGIKRNIEPGCLIRIDDPGLEDLDPDFIKTIDDNYWELI